jgi:4-amino-4-deoxy-L-arabinose transferase-like glycosyltransferase
LLLKNGLALEPISDEGVYVTTAKALATTGEYKIIALPGDPYQTKYPILYPWMLSLIWRLNPDFPSNIALFRWLSILFGLGFLYVLFFLLSGLLEGKKMMGLLIVGLCALHPAVISSSTAILSEAVYLFSSCLALLAVIKLDRRAGSTLHLFLAALGLAFSFYVRVVGVALIAATIFHFVLRKRWRDFVGLVLLMSMVLSPWLYWCHVRDETARFPEYIYNTNYLSDFKQLIELQGLGASLAKNLTHIVLGIPKLLVYPSQTDLRLITILMAWLGLPILILFIMGFFRSIRSGVNGIVHGYTLAYLIMLLLWPYPPGERFLLPLLPFFFSFVLIEISHIIDQAKMAFIGGQASDAWKSVSLILIPLILVGVSVLSLSFHFVRFAVHAWEELKLVEDREKDLMESFCWLEKETRPSDFLMAYLYPLYYLYTGRKTAPMSFNPKRKLTEPQFISTPVRKHRIKYLVVGELDFAVYTSDVVQAMRQELWHVITASGGLLFKKVFRSVHGKYEIYEINDESQSNS